ncbi:MAG: hypothetical protein JW722_02025 [Demequinaceae bacterium]|nr:hypothetical protein [Demequinaceae bacterium]
MNQRSSRSRRRRRLWRRWALAVGLTATVAVVTVASAAQLSVFGRDRTTDEAAPCTTLTLPTAATGPFSHGGYTQVLIESIPSECNGLTVSLVVYGSGGTELATGTGTTGALGSAIITTGSYRGTDVQGVALLIGTWGVRTTWTSVPSTPSVSCIALNNGRNPQLSRTCSVVVTGTSGTYPNSSPPDGEMMNFTFNVTTTGAHWRVTIDFTHPDFSWVPVWVGQYSNEVRKASGFTCASPLDELIIEDENAFWGATLYIGENGPPSWWGGQTLCP